MLSIKIENRKTTVEMNGTVGELINEALNIVGHLYKQLDMKASPAGRVFIAGIPMILKDYAEHTEEYEKSYLDPTTTEEEPHENDTL